MRSYIKNLIYRFRLRKFYFLPVTKKKYPPSELFNKRFFVCLKLIQKNNYKNILEIGSYRGDLTYFLCKNLKDIKLTSIDPYLEYQAENNVYVKSEQMIELKNNLINSLSKEIETKKFSMIQKKSSDCFNIIEDKSFDFIFIDGDHSYEACLSDLENYYDKVRDGGIICLHDYNRKTVPGVKLAVDEFSSKRNISLYEEKNYCVYFYK